jgi:hypothetical protein
MLQNTLNTQYIRHYNMLMRLQYLPPHALLAQTSMKNMFQSHKKGSAIINSQNDSALIDQYEMILVETNKSTATATTSPTQKTDPCVSFYASNLLLLSLCTAPGPPQTTDRQTDH